MLFALVCLRRKKDDLLFLDTDAVSDAPPLPPCSQQMKLLQPFNDNNKPVSTARLSQRAPPDNLILRPTLQTATQLIPEGFNDLQVQKQLSARLQVCLNS